jgi:hypothetical protein
VRRTLSFWESRIDLTEQQLTEIRSKLGSAADAFIDRARLAGGEYRNVATAWGGPSPAEVRRSIEELASKCSQAAAAIASLPEAAPSLVRQGQALDASQESNPELRLSMETELEQVEIHLRRIASACTRAAAFRVLNQGQGNTTDDARRHLISQLGTAYRDTVGTEPARRSAGKFATVAKIVLVAAGADPGISNDLLMSIFGPVR